MIRPTPTRGLAFCARAGRGGALPALLFAFLAAAASAAQSLPASAQDALPTRAPPGTALLVNGPDPASGLPFFGPNAIPSLRGSYLLDADRVELWFTRDLLYFDSSWKGDNSWSTRGLKALTRPGNGGAAVLALSAANWTLFFTPPSPPASTRRFVQAFIDRFTFFLDHAATDAELSFPASVAY